jgi:predicted RNase H-like HicB family nuclease
MKITVVIEKSENNWSAHTPAENLAIYATGASREEVIENFRDSLKGWMDYRRDTGQDAPDVTELEVYEAKGIVPDAAKR